MTTKPVTTAGTLGLGVLILSACVSQSQYDAAAAENQRLKAQLAALQAEQKYVEAADYLFPSGGFQLSPAGQAELANNIVPKLKGLQNAKIVVYGFTDNTPVGPELRRQGIPDNLVLSTRRAATVANFLVAQGINPNIVSAKGGGDPGGAATTDAPGGGAKKGGRELRVGGRGANGKGGGGGTKAIEGQPPRPHPPLAP